MDNQFKGIVRSEASKVMAKSNGSSYVLMNVEITEGPAKGKIVASTRTITNASGVAKAVPAIGQEVTLWHQCLESNSESGKFVHFFEIQTGIVSTSNDELSALLGVSQLVGQEL
jgi:hypothetical protein